MWKRPAWQSLSKALDISSVTARVAQDLLKTQVILSDTTVKRSTVHWEDLKPYCKSQKRSHSWKWSTSLLLSKFFKPVTTQTRLNFLRNTHFFMPYELPLRWERSHCFRCFKVLKDLTFAKSQWRQGELVNVLCGRSFELLLQQEHSSIWPSRYAIRKRRTDQLVHRM